MIIEYFYSHKRSPLHLITRSATVAAMAASVSTWSMRTPKTDSVGRVCKTIIGYLPIIPAPAQEMDTVMTVLQRCKQITQALQQKVTVVTFDQALYYRARELVWLKPYILNNVIIRLGGYHAAMNFLGVIGQHFAEAGLLDTWDESGLYSEDTATKILKGTSWNRAICAHKVTCEALFRLMLQNFQTWPTENEKTSFHTLAQQATALASSFQDTDTSESIKDALDNCLPLTNAFNKDFDDFMTTHENNATLAFWKQYLDMVGILLRFIRAEREGIWSLHINSFQEMLPLMVLYDHANYSRWGTIYLADMQQLPHTAPEVNSEFMAGNFVVKESSGSFNQLHTDQALEYINKMCNSSGGLIGITKIQSALNRWMLTCCDRARLSAPAKAMVGCSMIINKAKRRNQNHAKTEMKVMLLN